MRTPDVYTTIAMSDSIPRLTRLVLYFRPLECRQSTARDMIHISRLWQTPQNRKGGAK